LDSWTHDLTKARETIAAQVKELEVAQKAQSEVETLRKELAEARQALSLKEVDSAQLADFNS
jgi:hypothetical protein